MKSSDVDCRDAMDNGPFAANVDASAREEDCEYTDNYSRARAEVLEEDISRIQFRIHQLEHPQEAKTDVMLLDPY
ncbi:Copper-fist domain-containing protein [Mycena indigotica]|uniref:Copper-fist domain-containing protein n=1 Tax=Mycena indigotica TaxID=2126181 RepID=A0A8H6VVN2_9AGAR|nr:Copper-fist domain-containing protein [Mycena indigotica]KAF7293596.1 Copper-fist domain-containing protein [Mycena indigotica]